MLTPSKPSALYFIFAIMFFNFVRIGWPNKNRLMLKRIFVEYEPDDFIFPVQHQYYSRNHSFRLQLKFC